MGKIALLELKGASLGCSQVIWESETEDVGKNQSLNLAIDRTSKERVLEVVQKANSEITSRSVTLPPNSLQ